MIEGHLPEKKNSPIIWTIGGGKGGSGKTFVCSAFATLLARLDYTVILIDLDIGAPNLHNFLGIQDPKKSLTLFFERKKELEELPMPTVVPNLRFIAGDVHSLSTEGTRLYHRRKLYNHIPRLKSDYILIDIGAGSDTHVLDTFLLADKKIAVINPETISMENFYQFIKNALFRKLTLAFRPYGFRDLIDQVWKFREHYKLKNIWDLMNWLKTNFPFSQSIIESEIASFRIDFLLNQIRTRQDIELGHIIKSAFIKFLDLDVRYAGHIEYKTEVANSIARGYPFMVHYANSPSAQEIETCLYNLIREKEAL
ncbi:MAG: AAA family ATPase [Acidobacteria bacterium]|nr:AAA family ATPase [Acidobacteriota bacterium]MBU4494505.1 AAA family ATPase [Acidobacteriota bacterium]